MNVETWLQQQRVPFEFSTHGPAYSAQELAANEGVSGHDVAKPVIIKGLTGYAMCVLPGCRRLSLQRVADLLHDPSVRLATENEMATLFPDCELGAEPPLGPMYGMQTIMDEHLVDDDILAMQAGTHRTAVRLRREDWQRVCHPMVAMISQN